MFTFSDVVVLLTDCILSFLFPPKLTFSFQCFPSQQTSSSWTSSWFFKFPNFRPADRWNPKSQIIPKLGRILKFKPQPCYKLIKTLLQTENEGRVGYWAVATIFRFCSIFLCSASQRVQPTVGNSLLLSYTLHPNNTQIARTGNNNKCPAGWFYFLSLYHSKGQDNFQE